MPSYSVSPIGQALQGFGNVVARIGEQGMARAREEDEQAKAEADKAAKFGAQSRFLQFEQEWRKAALDRAEQVKPGAAGYVEGIQKDYSNGARQFFSSIPDDLKPEYDLRLADLEGNLTEGADKFARAERDRYALEQIGTGQDTLLSRQSAQPGSWADVRREGEGLIQNSGLPSITADEEVRKWRQRQAKALFEVENGSDPVAARSSLGIGTGGSLVDKIVGVESGGSDTAKNPKSSATGAGQFIESTWRSFIAERHPELLAQGEDIQKFRNDRALSREAVQWYADSNAAVLQSHGLPVDDGTLYLSHFAGPQGAVKLLSADPNDAVESVLGSSVVKANPFLKGKTAAEVIAWADRKMGTTGPAPQYADIPYEDRAKLYEESQKQQVRATNSQVEDYEAFLRSGQGASTGDAAGSRFQLPELASVYGAEQANTIREQLDKAAALGNDVAATQFASPEELSSMAARRAADLGTPTNFRQNLQDLNGLQSVIRQRNTEINNDPALYVQKDEKVASAFKAMTDADSGDPEQQRALVENYVTQADELQAKLGLSPFDRKLLPKAYAEQIVQQFKTQPQGGQNAATMMRSLEGEWGKHWPRVFGELSKDLPGTALVVGAMSAPGQERAAERLAEASALGTKDLEEALPKDTVKPIKDELDATLAPFAATLANNNSSSAVRTYNTFKEGVYQLALSYARDGDTDALEHAYNDVLGKAYTMKDTFRVPLQYDADLIEENAGKVLQNIEGGLALPGSLAGLPEDQTKTAYLSAVKNNGFWVTSPDESGLTLHVPARTGGSEAVVTEKGEPLSLTWREIIDLGNEIKAPRPPNVSGDLPYGIGSP